MPKKFFKFFLVFLLLTIVFHPKPICDVTRARGYNCTPFLSSWISSRPEFESINVESQLAPKIRNLSFEERYFNAEVGFDFLIAISVAATTTFIALFLSKYKMNKILFIVLIIGSWMLFTYVVSWPYQLNAFKEYHGSVFKPISGGIE